MAMVEAIPGWRRITLGADKGYDSKEFVAELRDHQVTSHLACKATTIIDERTTRHPGYLISQQKRKRIEEIFGWLKTVAGCARRAIAERRGLAGCFASHWSLTTWSGCATCCRQPHEIARD
jgi:hypothetical protein